MRPPSFYLDKNELIVEYEYSEPIAENEGETPPKPINVALMFLVDRSDGKVQFKSKH
jgi:hypothetical protein